MATTFFLCISPTGAYQECSYGGPSIESCFETLTYLVKADWQLIRIGLEDRDGTYILLPVEAFDGESLTEPLKQLQAEWEQLLFQE